MARLFFTYPGPSVTPSANPTTLYQIVAAANQRSVLKSIEIMPAGVTAATAPILFDVCTQGDGVNLTDDTSTLVKNLVAAAEALQTTILKQSTGEPGSPVTQYLFTLHQQGTRVWVPPNRDREIIIPGGGRLGIRYRSSVYVAVRLQLELEE